MASESNPKPSKIDFTPSSDSNKAVAVLDFGGDKTSTSGTFTIQFPAADASNAILRLA